MELQEFSRLQAKSKGSDGKTWKDLESTIARHRSRDVRAGRIEVTTSNGALSRMEGAEAHVLRTIGSDSKTNRATNTFCSRVASQHLNVKAFKRFRSPPKCVFFLILFIFYWFVRSSFPNTPSRCPCAAQGRTSLPRCSLILPPLLLC